MKITNEYNALYSLSNSLEEYNSDKKILLVTGKKSYQLCGAKKIVEEQLENTSYVVFNDFSINPLYDDVLKGLEIAKSNNVDLIIAIGGGSVIDMAKMIKALVGFSAEEHLSVIEGATDILEDNISLVVIPTTAGSGSEATHFAVVYVEKEKYSVASPFLLPKSIILDGKLLKTASPYQKAVNGLDALAQSIESYWSAGSTIESKSYSMKAIELLIDNLPLIIDEKTSSKEALQSVMQGANFAGMAINLTKTTAAHAFSYAFTSYYNIPHGHAVWLTLPKIFEIHVNSTVESITDKRGHTYLEKTMQELKSSLRIPENMSAEIYLKNYMEKIGVDSDMNNIDGLVEKERRILSTKVNAQRLSNNPVQLSELDIKDIYSLGNE